MKLASRKNMMSINGMISIRAFLCGMGEATFIVSLPLDRRAVAAGRDRRRRISLSLLLCASNITSRFVAAVCSSNSKLDTREVKKLNGISAKIAMPRPHAVAMSASAIPPVTAVHRQFFVAEEAERLHQTGDRSQQTEQRRERDQRVHDHEEPAGALDFDTGGDLQRALKRSVLVVQTVPHHAQNRIARIAGETGSFGDIADFDRGEDFLDPLRIAAHPASRATRKCARAQPSKAMIDTIRIGHMIGPPLRKLSMKKFLSSSVWGLAAGR